MLDFNKETEDLFRELPQLEAKLDKLKQITVKVSSLCIENEIKISFGVFEAFKELSETPVKQMRGLKILKVEKSHFVATF